MKIRELKMSGKWVEWKCAGKKEFCKLVRESAIAQDTSDFNNLETYQNCEDWLRHDNQNVEIN